MSEGPLIPSDLLPGAQHFNRGEYFEAHEEWEKTWYGREGEEGRFLKGLIQIAVSLYHLESGNLKGAYKVMGTALGYLKEFPSPQSGVDLDLLCHQMASMYEELAEGRDPYPKVEASAPQLSLKLD